MTLLFMEGFETAADETDVSARGSFTNNYLIGSSQCNSLAVPSRTGYPGKGLFLRGNNNYWTSPNYSMNGAAYNDFGMFETNQSVYSLWQAGGFAVGFSA